ncbi:uncharacterized protein LOC121994692 [Zingiber officinale]|uniref:uncharacterized protein LOC121994692 n=1 Tax=Zingiber officinale TaxID=94328 RepID=UPI001C4D73F5|nr:uncharacterized protein LOC121994692 [Zingiber officinale]
MKEEQEAAASTSLQQTLQLVSSLVSSSYSIPCFAGKWQLIRSKLEQLVSGLTVATNSNCFSKANELAKLILSTLGDVSPLLDRCSDGSYVGGKLHLRSDLDAVVCKLEFHINSFTEMNSSPNVMNSQAIILSKPGANASREDIKFYIKDLLSRLRIGDPIMRIQTLVALKEILVKDEKHVRIMTTEVNDAIDILVAFLEYKDAGVQEGAAGVLSVIAELNSHRGALVASGAIAPLIQVLEKSTELGKESSAKVLRKLTEKSDNGWSVSAHGGITALLKICVHPNSSKELVVLACQILKNLSSVEEMRRFMVEEGAIRVLLKLSNSIEEAHQIQAIELLQDLASGDQSIKQIVIREGIIDSLLQLLDPASPYTAKAREVGLMAAQSLCFSSASSINTLINSGFLQRSLFYLNHGEVSIQELALKSFSRLCEISADYRKAMGNAGLMPQLVRLTGAKSSEIREKSAEILDKLIFIDRNRRKFIEEEHNVNQIMRCLALEDRLVTKNHLLSVLKAVAESSNGRRMIMASGCVHYVEKLAEANELEAKKVMKKLSCNRLRNILNAIWSP